MNGINAPKVIECIGSDGNKYRQLAKSGNDDLRQDAVCSYSYILSMRKFYKNAFTMYCLRAFKYQQSSSFLILSFSPSLCTMNLLI
jgi:hypothetical protein